ncbi:MAG: Mfa1 fimbrilin C-terminal domain-containing protein [Prevotella sp.]|nr:Mfa1 fimbrilin C-terminal domain-containing protein [Prevotella sp.]
MKKLSFLALAIAGMLFAACSSDKDVAGGEGPNPIAVGNKGYFKVNLNLPTTVVSSMRAGEGWDESENLADGLEEEYAVNSVLFLIFEGDNEASATLKQVMTPTKTMPDPDADDNPNHVTAVKEYVAKLDNAPTNNLFALAVLNGTGIIEQGSTSTTIKLNGSDDDYSGTVKIATLQTATSNSMKESNKFFMTNAVLSTKQGGSADPTASPALQILAPVKSEYIYETQDAAEAGVPATDIYVERGVAKVTVKNSISVNDGIQTKDEDAVTATFGGWTLDNTEKESYIVRKVPADLDWNLTSKQAITTDKYRFVGGNAVDALYGTSKLFRTYWAEDPQYSSVVAAAKMNRSTSPTFQAGVGETNPQYCHENTFDVANQTHENTTRIIVKVNLSATDFYTIGADRKTLYSFDNVRDLVVTSLLDQSAFSAYWTTNGGGATLTLAGIDIADLKDGDAGVIEISDVTIKKEAYDPDKTADVSVKNEVPGGAAIINTLNTQLAKVEKFKDGDTYYVIRVQHFGDLLTPWNSSEYKEGNKPVTGDVAAIYPDATDHRQIPNYLGRYGMVRNNWYDINLGEILKIGNSTVPTLPSDTTPDDDLEELYIKARINILSWAKRTQSWTLK